MENFAFLNKFNQVAAEQISHITEANNQLFSNVVNANKSWGKMTNATNFTDVVNTQLNVATENLNNWHDYTQNISKIAVDALSKWSDVWSTASKTAVKRTTDK